jgi:hypothetical protein
MKWHDAKKEWPDINSYILAVDDDRDFILGYSRQEYIKDWKLGDMPRDEVTYWCYLSDIKLPN